MSQRSSVLLVLLLVTLPCVPAAASGAPSAPASWRLSGGVVPTAYALELHLDPSQDRFRGQVWIDVRVERPTRAVRLHARDLEIVRATFVGPEGEVDLSPRHEEPDILQLAAPAALPTGAATLEIAFAGAFETTATQGIFKQVDRGRPYLFTQFQAIDARQAFPCFDEPGFKTPWRLTLVVPEGQEAFANTPLEASVATDGGRRLRFAATPPLPSYLVAFAVGPFETIDAGRVGTTPLRIVALAGKGARATFAVEATAPLVRLHEEYLGTALPFAKLDSLAIPQTVGFGAMENAGLITYAEDLLLPERRTPEADRDYALTGAHEIAHQWFGDLVTPAWWDDIWLNESFANWMERKIVDRWQPDWGIDAERVEAASRTMEADALATARAVRQAVGDENEVESAFDPITYGKGSALLEMFEAWMGEERFQDAIRAYLREHARGTATSDEFLRALDTHGAAGTAAAFATFLDRPGVPLVDLQTVCDERGIRLNIAQERLRPVGSQAEPGAPWTFPFCFRWRADGREERACHLLDAGRESIPLPTSACPDWVLGNAGGRGYYRVRYDATEEARLPRAGLSAAERLSTLLDLAALADAGRVPLDRALAAATSLPADATRRELEAALAVVAAADERVAAGDRRRWAEIVRSSFGGRARELGWTPAPGESDDVRMLRERLVPLVADLGEDRVLRAEAGRLAAAWVGDRHAIAPELVGPVLRTAALDGDAATFDRWLAAAKASEERGDRLALLRGLGSFRDPELHRRALALTLDETFDPREVGSIVWASSGDPAARERAWTFVSDRFDTLTARWPPVSAGGLPWLAAGFCTPERRTEVEALFASRIASLRGGPQNLAQALEVIDLCAAAREAKEDGVAAFLAR